MSNSRPTRPVNAWKNLYCPLLDGSSCLADDCGFFIVIGEIPDLDSRDDEGKITRMIYEGYCSY